MKGSYILIIKLDRDKKIKVGKLGDIRFKRGYYLYVGSALNGLEGRLKRHLSKNKRMHWHVDYLLNEGRIVNIYVKIGERKEECEIASYFSRKYHSIDDFGSSDCKCKSHLFFSDSKKGLIETIRSLGMVEFGKF